ncbi:MAG TPA: hypothetical protein VMY05_08840 [Acidobacteriota bacterium]|nr:hypothetical protein [Acidobacteriota bacterium]
MLKLNRAPELLEANPWDVPPDLGWEDKIGERNVNVRQHAFNVYADVRKSVARGLGNYDNELATYFSVCVPEDRRRLFDLHLTRETDQTDVIRLDELGK